MAARLSHRLQAIGHTTYMALARSTLCWLTHFHGPSSFNVTRWRTHHSTQYDIGSIATQNTIYYLKHCLCLCVRKNSTQGVFRDKYSTWLCLVLYLSVNMPPCAVFSLQIHASALNNMQYTFCSDFSLMINHQLQTKITTIMFICIYKYVAFKHDLQLLYQHNSVFLPEFVVCQLHHVYTVLPPLIVELHPSSFFGWLRKF